jgi:hypothetical protein
LERTLGRGLLCLQVVEQCLGLHYNLLMLVLFPAKEFIVSCLLDAPHKRGYRG